MPECVAQQRDESRLEVRDERLEPVPVLDRRGVQRVDADARVLASLLARCVSNVQRVVAVPPPKVEEGRSQTEGNPEVLQGLGRSFVQAYQERRQALLRRDCLGEEDAAAPRNLAGHAAGPTAGRHGGGRLVQTLHAALEVELQQLQRLGSVPPARDLWVGRDSHHPGPGELWKLGVLKVLADCPRDQVPVVLGALRQRVQRHLLADLPLEGDLDHAEHVRQLPRA
mmetsp:Transcript_6623/g.23853  ORF Transcript_6623/g.23853 Transcript_6623/m.23853 type:complete len:226 (+) Transcript_6623:809-1486(+)